MSAKSALAWLCVVAAIAVAAASAGGGGRAASGVDRGGQPAVRPGQTVAAQVTRIVDGDTVRVRTGGATETVRYIGVDTPESVKPDTPVQCYGTEASRRNAQLVDSQTVRLVIGAEPRDRFGRLLAYVYRASDGRFVNATLAAEGYARALTIPPNVAHAAELKDHVAAAQRARRGQWGACPGARR